MAKAMTNRELDIVATDAVRAMNGDDKSIMLGAHIVRLLTEIKRLRDAEKAKSKRSSKTRKVEILHRYHSWSDGRGGIEYGKRVEDAITCPDKNNGCPDCKRRRGSFYETY